MRQAIFITLYAAAAFFVAALASPASAQATTYFYCDTVLTLGGQCGIWIDSSAVVVTNTVVIGGIQTCRYDISGVSVGAHQLSCDARSVAAEPIYGAQVSAKATPIAYTRAAALPAPTNLHVGP